MLVTWALFHMLNILNFNLRSGVLSSEECKRKAARDSAVSQALVRREKSFSRPPTLALLYCRAPPKKEHLIAGYLNLGYVYVCERVFLCVFGFCQHDPCQRIFS